MSTLQPLQFYFMHFKPYPDVAPDRPRGQWVDPPMDDSIRRSATSSARNISMNLPRGFILV